MAKSRRKTAEAVSTANDTVRQSFGATTVVDVNRERIAARAYELYLARGGTDGWDMDDWLAAEREVRNGSDESNGER